MLQLLQDRREEFVLHTIIDISSMNDSQTVHYSIKCNVIMPRDLAKYESDTIAAQLCIIMSEYLFITKLSGIAPHNVLIL